MAFTNNSNTRNDNQNEKAIGFINIWLPTKEGKKRKLIGVPLKASKPRELALFNWLDEDPDRAMKLARNATFDFQSVEITEGSEFAMDDSTDGAIAEATAHLRQA